MLFKNILVLHKNHSIFFLMQRMCFLKRKLNFWGGLKKTKFRYGVKGWQNTAALGILL
jgi:hypothetical protein